MRFDAATHTYYADDGSGLPSVTKVCGVASPFQAFGRDEAMEDSRDIGRDVHLLTQLHDEGDLDESTIDPFYAGYLDAWKAFVTSFSFASYAVEEEVYHPRYAYAGTLDRVGLGVFHGKPARALVDIKTGVPMDVTALQTAAYAEAWNVMHPKRRIERRLAVYLRDDGKYLVEPHTEGSDFAVFLAALTVQRWRNLHK